MRELWDAVAESARTYNEAADRCPKTRFHVILRQAEAFLRFADTVCTSVKLGDLTLRPSAIPRAICSAMPPCP